MTGFISGVAAVLVLDQLAPLVGFSPKGVNEVMQFVDLVRHFAHFRPENKNSTFFSDWWVISAATEARV